MMKESIQLHSAYQKNVQCLKKKGQFQSFPTVETHYVY